MSQLITDLLFEQIMAIRDSGKYNMLDVKGVQYEAFQLEYYELATFLDEHPKEYARFIFSGDRC